MAFIEPTEGEAQSAAEVADARRAFLSEPPEFINNDPEPEPDPAAQAAADEAAAIEELSKPPAAPEGGSAATATPPPPAPASTGTLDPYAEFGGEQAVRTAHEVQQALRTQEGVRALVANGLTALGYSVDQIRAALDGAAAPAGEAAPPAAPADPFAGLDDDEVVDVKTMRQYAQTLAAQAADAAVKQALGQVEPQVKSVQDAIAEQRQTAVRTWTDSALIEVLGTPPENPEEGKVYKSTVDATVQRAGAYYDPSRSNDPAHIRACIQQAHADLEQESEARLQAYIATKKRARDAQPVNVGGGAGAEGPLPEPQNMAQAREQARKTGFFG